MMNYLLYIDPGSGSYLVQVIIAAVLGGWFWLKSYWSGIKSYFHKKKSGNSATDSVNSENETVI